MLGLNTVSAITLSPVGRMSHYPLHDREYDDSYSMAPVAHERFVSYECLTVGATVTKYTPHVLAPSRASPAGHEALS